MTKNEEEAKRAQAMIVDQLVEKGVSRTDAQMIMDVGTHAANEALATGMRIVDAAPMDIRFFAATVLVTALQQIAGDAQKMMDEMAGANKKDCVCPACQLRKKLEDNDASVFQDMGNGMVAVNVTELVKAGVGMDSIFELLLKEDEGKPN